MTRTPQPFESAETWEEAAERLAFEPRVPGYTAGRSLSGLSVRVRDHRLRELARADRTLEAHYGTFVLSQTRMAAGEARDRALEVRYGPAPRPARILGREGRTYALGPEVPPDDPDGRRPAVVTWHDADMHYLLASDALDVERLLRIATSMYGQPPSGRPGSTSPP